MVEVGLRRFVSGDGLAIPGDLDLWLSQGLVRDIDTPMEKSMRRLASVDHGRGPSPLGLASRPFAVLSAGSHGRKAQESRLLRADIRLRLEVRAI